jgi:hypothetical protein
MKLLLFLAMFALLAILAYVVISDAPNCPISRTGYNRLAPGMTEAEVIKLLQVSPGDYTTGPVDPVNPPMGHIGEPPEGFTPARSASWRDDCTGVEVEFDRDGKMVHASGWTQQRAGLIPAIRRLFRPDNLK